MSENLDIVKTNLDIVKNGTYHDGVTVTRPSYHHGDLRRALLDALEQIVSERGADGVSLRETARRAGVSHSAPAHHFGDLDGMLNAMAAEGFDHLGAAMNRAIAEVDGRDDATSVDYLRALGSAYLHFAVEHPAHYDVMFRSPKAEHEDWEEYQKTPAGIGAVSTFGPLAVIIGRLVEEGMVAPEQGRYAATMLWGMCHGIATLWIDGRIQGFYEDHTIEQLIDGVMDTTTSLLLSSGAPS